MVQQNNEINFNPNGYDTRYCGSFFHKEDCKFYSKGCEILIKAEKKISNTEVISNGENQNESQDTNKNEVDNSISLENKISAIKPIFLANSVLNEMKAPTNSDKNCVLAFSEAFAKTKALTQDEKFSALKKVTEKSQDELTTTEKVAVYQNITQNSQYSYKDKISALDIILESSGDIPKPLHRHIINKKKLLEKVDKSNFVMVFEDKNKLKKKQEVLYDSKALEPKADVENQVIEEQTKTQKVSDNIKEMEQLAYKNQVQENKLNNISDLIYKQDSQSFNEKIHNIKKILIEKETPKKAHNETSNKNNLVDVTQELSEDKVKKLKEQFKTITEENSKKLKRTAEIIQNEKSSVYNKLDRLNKIVADKISDDTTLTRVIVNSDEYFKFGAGSVIKLDSMGIDFAVPSGYFAYDGDNENQILIYAPNGEKPLTIDISKTNTDIVNLSEFFNANIKDCKENDMTYKNTSICGLPAVIKSKSDRYKLSIYNKQTLTIMNVEFEFSKSFINHKSVINRVIAGIKIRRKTHNE